MSLKTVAQTGGGGSGSGTVTNVATGTGLTGGPITTTGTISLANTTVVAGSYGNAATVGTFTVNVQGQLTAASNATISIPASAINTAIPNSGLANSSITINGTAISLGGSGTVTASTVGTLTLGTGLTGTSFNGSTNVTTNLANTTVTAGSYGNASTVGSFTVDAQGRLTAASNAAIAIAASQITSGTLGATSGGTGQSTVTTGDLLYGSASNTWGKLADVATGSVLVSGGVGVAPFWSATPTVTTLTATTLTAPTHNSASSLTFQTNGTTTAMTINGSQQVAISTTSSNYGLSVTSASFSPLVVTGSSTVSGIQFVNSAYNNGYIYYDNGPNMLFDVAGNEMMRIASNGNVGIGTTPNASAIFDAQSTTKGVRFPNMTTTQKNAISSPAAGLVVFDTTLAKLCVYSGSAWQTITSV